MQRLFDIRWGLYYSNKKPVYGAWSVQEPKAFLQDIKELMQATIEAKELSTGKTNIVASCMRKDFLQFRWHKVKPNVINMNLAPIIYGLMIVTRNKKISFFINGEIKKEENQEKTIHELSFL